MNPTLSKRIAVLEQASPDTAKVIFIILVGVGEAGQEIVHIYDSHDNRWDRLPDESEREFKDRATAETPRTENQMAMLFGKTSHID